MDGDQVVVAAPHMDGEDVGSGPGSPRRLCIAETRSPGPGFPRFFPANRHVGDHEAEREGFHVAPFQPDPLLEVCQVRIEADAEHLPKQGVVVVPAQHPFQVILTPLTSPGWRRATWEERWIGRRPGERTARVTIPARRRCTFAPVRPCEGVTA